MEKVDAKKVVFVAIHGNKKIAAEGNIITSEEGLVKVIKNIGSKIPKSIHKTVCGIGAVYKETALALGMPINEFSARINDTSLEKDDILEFIKELPNNTFLFTGTTFLKKLGISEQEVKNATLYQITCKDENVNIKEYNA